MFSRIRKIVPDTEKQAYLPGDTINWTVRYPGLQIRPGSFHLLGYVKVEYTNDDGIKVPLADDGSTEIYTEPAIGAHGFLKSISYSTARNGTVENLNPYPLLVKSLTDFTIDRESLDTESRYAMEARCRNEVINSGYLPGESDDFPYLSFALHLEFAGNNSYAMVRDSNGIMQEIPVALRYSDHGDIRISVILSRELDVLYGAKAGVGTYTLSNLQLYYEVDPETPEGTEGYYKIYSCGDGELNGTQNTIYSTAAGATNAVHMTFMPKAWLQDATKNKYSTPALNSIPTYGRTAEDGPAELAYGFGAQSVNYTIADQGSALVAYTMDTREEMLIQTFRALGVNAINDNNAYWGTSIYSLSKPLGSYGYALGLAFGRALDLSRVKFSSTIKTQADLNDPWAVFLWLHQTLPFGKVVPKASGKLRA